MGLTKSRPSDPALDTRQAAAYLGIAPLTLETWRSKGRYGLPFEKIGRYVRYRQSDLDAFRARRTFTSTGEADAALDGAEAAPQAAA